MKSAILSTFMAAALTLATGCGGGNAGDSCSSDGDCQTGLCLNTTCTVPCSADDPASCADHGGLCVLLAEQDQSLDGEAACVGHFDTGTDDDDQLVRPGETVRATFDSPEDIDAFYLVTNDLDEYSVEVTCSNGCGLDFYSHDGTYLDTVDGDMGYPGLYFVPWTGTVYYAVVFNLWGDHSSYRVTLKQLERQP